MATAPLVAFASISPSSSTSQSTWGWGYNLYGQLGDGTTNDSSSPVQAGGLSGLTAISGGHLHSLALKSDGTVSAWGDNEYGQLGDGGVINSSSPVQVGGVTGVSAVAAGGYHSVALKSDGTVWTWGYNYFGQLGDGTAADRSSPVLVSGLTGVIAVAAGGYHSLALESDGTVWTWGYNQQGQLGDGTTIDRSSPVQVGGLTGVIAIAGGDENSVALKADGTVWAWGYNAFGQLGDGTTIDRSSPVQVGGLTGVSAVAAGGYHGLALKSDGTVWTWGYNGNGQLGDGTFSFTRPLPGQVLGLSGVTAIDGGLFHSLALKSDGTVWAWGYNYNGELGDAGTNSDSPLPLQVGGLSGATAISGGGQHSLALKGFALSVTKDGTGSGTVSSSPAGIDCGSSCSASFDTGTSVTLSAAPNSTSNFTGWSGAGCSGTGTCTVTVDQARSVTATFVPKCPRSVAVANYSFTLRSLASKQGECVLWSFDQGSHSVTDARRLGPSSTPLFGSGIRSSGTYSYIFSAAGKYRYRSKAAGDPTTMKGTIKVPLRISDIRGTSSTPIKVTWSSAQLRGYRFDVQYRYKAPGRRRYGSWTNWRMNQKATNGTFRANRVKGSGKYRLRARLENASTLRTSRWSAPKRITIF